jgi:hypothetical protein
VSLSVPDYFDVLADPAPNRRAIPTVAAELDLVVETADGAFCGAVVSTGRAVGGGGATSRVQGGGTVTLEDRHGRQRVFPLLPASFLLDGKLVTLVRPTPRPRAPGPRAKTASGSYAVRGASARVARSSRIWVEGVHDAALLERIWGDDLRVEGVVVEPLGGIDNLLDCVRSFRPNPQRRVGVLVDHLVAGSKESRIVDGVRRSGFADNVLVTGHPYIDVWQAVKPTALGIDRWPTIPRGTDWKSGICAALHVSGPAPLRGASPSDMWRRVLASVNSFADVEVPLLRAVEELLDFVTER